MRRKLCMRAAVAVAAAAVALAVPLRSIAQTPSASVLRKSNVSLEMEGINFLSGLNPDGAGNANGAGSEMNLVRWSGSAFIVDQDGTIVTNYHVARRALRGKAVFDDGASYEIKSIKIYDPVNDLAVLKINTTSKLKPAALGNSDKIKVMDKVIAVGNTLGMGFSVTEGTVNQLVKDSATGQLITIRHSAPIAPGNSGGALYRGGEVVGVNVATRPPYEIHYAIPINIAKPLIDKYPNAVPLESVFPPDVNLILQKAQHSSALNGKVPAKSGTNPGIYRAQFEFFPLEDYVVALTSPGRNLAVGVLSGTTNQWIGWSDYQGEEELLIIGNEYYSPVTVAVFNYDATPADFGLNIYYIGW